MVLIALVVVITWFEDVEIVVGIVVGVAFVIGLVIDIVGIGIIVEINGVTNVGLVMLVVLAVDSVAVCVCEAVCIDIFVNVVIDDVAETVNGVLVMTVNCVFVDFRIASELGIVSGLWLVLGT